MQWARASAASRPRNASRKQVAVWLRARVCVAIDWITAKTFFTRWLSSWMSSSRSISACLRSLMSMQYSTTVPASSCRPANIIHEREPSLRMYSFS